MDYATARLNMVESQVRTNKVTAPAVVAALLAVPRERFVPEKLRGVAYVDKDLPVGGARYLLEPMVLARLLQLAQIKPTDRVLDVGAATGYSSAVLAPLARSVVALEQTSGSPRRLAAPSPISWSAKARAGTAISAPASPK